MKKARIGALMVAEHNWDYDHTHNVSCSLVAACLSSRRFLVLI